MASPGHGSRTRVAERVAEYVGASGSIFCIGATATRPLLGTNVTVAHLDWGPNLAQASGEHRGLPSIAILGPSDPFDSDLIDGNREFWRRLDVVIVEGVSSPVTHSLALLIAEITIGEITIDAGADDDAFAWVEVPKPTVRPSPISYGNTIGVLPEGMIVPSPSGLANDYSFIADRVDCVRAHTEPVSVVIPLFNRRDMLERTLGCLLHQTYPRELIEIVVADDGSSDLPLEVVDKYSDRLNVRYVRQRDEGYRLSSIRNLGIRAASHEHLILLDCDMAPVPGFVEAYSRWLTASSEAIFLGHRRYVDANSVEPQSLVQSPDQMLALPDIVTGNPLEVDEHNLPTTDWRLPIYQRSHNLRFDDHPFRTVCGGNIAFHRSLFERIGQFDEDFTAWGAEDAEWGFRAWNQGAYIIPVVQACGLHQEPPGGRNETDRELGREETFPKFVERCPVRYRTEREDGALHEVPLVSIYMPAYNAQDTIVEAVESALAQSITDLEVCIVDDGSTDNTIKVLQQHFGGNPRVRWMSQSNGGIGAASNAAVRMCTGAFIGQLDSDDILEPDAVKDLLGVLEQDSRLGLAYGCFEYLETDGTFKRGPTQPEFSREVLLTSMIVSPFRLFRSRDWYRTAGFDEKLRNAIDYDMYLKLSEVTEVVGLGKKTYNYRLGETSTSVVDRGEQDRNNLKVIRQSLQRRGLASDWELTTPDPTLPRKVEFQRRTNASEFTAEVPRVSAKIVVEGPVETVDENVVIETLRAERPQWTWISETQPGAKRFRISGPRLRRRGAERHRRALKAAVDPWNDCSYWLLDAVPFSDFTQASTSTPVASPRRPLGGGVYVPPADPNAKSILIGVTTLNRLDYLRHFLQSFNQTRSDDYRWTVVIADDGSTDGTKDWLFTQAKINAEVIVVENFGQTISGQTNSIFAAALATDFDIGFKVDDDIFFEKPGWDHLYIDAISDSGLGHLVFHSDGYKPGVHQREKGSLKSSVRAPECMGCFYSFTRDVIETTGYLDETSFPIRGHAHIDFTMRACRLGHNEIEQLWDASTSEEYIDLWSGPEYQQTFDWSSAAAKTITEPAEKARRWAIVGDESRFFVPERPLGPLRKHSRVHTSPSLDSIVPTITQHPRMVAGDLPVSAIDGAWVLNLDRDVNHYAVSHEIAKRHGLAVERFRGVDGRTPEVIAEWEEYQSEGLIRPLERFMGRKLIASPGAWAYLSGLRQMIERAKQSRMKKLLVFDDDVMLSKDFGDRFPLFLDSLPEGWVLALLGWTPSGDAPFVPYDSNLLSVNSSFNGSYAFIVDSVAFDLLLHEIDRRIWPFDSGALRAVAEAFPEDCFAPRTALAIANVRFSRIRGGRPHQAFWREMGHDPTLYEPRRFELEDLTEPSATRDSFRLSMLVEASPAVEDTIAQVRSLLDQRAGNFEVTLLTVSGADRETLVELAASDPRLHVVGGDGTTRSSLLTKAAAESTGAIVGRVSPGLVVDSDFVYERVRAFLEAEAPARQHGPSWWVVPREQLTEDMLQSEPTPATE